MAAGMSERQRERSQCYCAPDSPASMASDATALRARSERVAGRWRGHTVSATRSFAALHAALRRTRTQHPRGASAAHARCTATVTARATTAAMRDGHAVRAASSARSDGREALVPAPSAPRCGGWGSQLAAPGASSGAEVRVASATPSACTTRAMRRRGAVSKDRRDGEKLGRGAAMCSCALQHLIECSAGVGCVLRRGAGAQYATTEVSSQPCGSLAGSMAISCSTSADKEKRRGTCDVSLRRRQPSQAKMRVTHLTW